MKKPVPPSLLSILLLTLIIALASTQSSNRYCYANCLQGSCLDASPFNCTGCDSGLVNLNGQCVGGNTQPDPLVLLRPTSTNQFNTSGIIVVNCSVTNGQTPANLIFSRTVGFTFTRPFTIPASHSYIQVKFNAIVIDPLLTTVKSDPSFIMTIYSSSQTIIYSTTKSLPAPIRTGNVSCGSTTTVKDIFFISQKITTSQNNIVLEVKGTDRTNDVIGISDIEIYFGGCSLQCGQCRGPSPSDCTSCQGLFQVLTVKGNSSTCGTCPSGYYSDVICKACPIQCATCSMAGAIVSCLTCPNGVSTNVSNLCVFKGTAISDLTGLSFTDSTTWKSSESTGSIITQCGQYSLLGGLAIGNGGSTLTKVFNNLAVHTQIFIQFTMFLIDQQLNDIYTITIKIDQITQSNTLTIAPEAPGQVLTNECGQQTLPQKIFKQEYSFPHNATSVTIVISGLKGYFGVRDFIIQLNNQTNVQNCGLEDNNLCLACINGLKLTNNTCSGCSDGYYLDPASATCHICPIQCKTCGYEANSQNKLYCLTCQTPLVLDIDGSRQCVDSNQNLFTTEIVPQIPQSSSKNQWVLYPKLQQHGVDSCGGESILGSSDIQYKFLSMKRTFSNLPAHSGAKVFFHFYQIDDFGADQSVYFIFNGNKTIYIPTLQRRPLCGNSTPDAIIKMFLQDKTHSGDSLTLELHMDRMGKFGINNLQVYLQNCPNCGGSGNYQIQTIPVYSIDTPPIRGMQSKLTFLNSFSNSTDLHTAFKNFIINPSRRMLQGTGLLIPDNSSTINDIWTKAGRQINSLLLLNGDQNGQILRVRPSNPSSIYFTDPSNNTQLVSGITNNATLPRYVEVGQDSLSNRSSMRNLKNLFVGCAILALWIGLFSFLFGMSAAFDDFFILVQVIFVHIFIHMRNNPPSFRIPLEGFQIVQFLSWLPMEARVAIENGILPSNLYQYSPIQYEQYFTDIAYARTIYHVIIFLALMLVIYLLLKIFRKIYESMNPSKQKYQSYFQYYYYNYQDKSFTFLDKVIRYVYFTIVWAVVLQIVHFDNSPSGFHIWNSILCILGVIFIFVYPVVGLLFLRKKVNEISAATFKRNYEEIRVNPQRLYYYLFRYYKLILIGAIIGFLYNSSPIIPLVLLIIIHLVDALLIWLTDPLGMDQEFKHDVLFYPNYPKVYKVTSIIQQFLFIILEIFMLILVGQRDIAVSSVYMGIGYVCCAIIILLLINGLVRLVWGFIKMAESCHSQKTTMALSIEKKLEDAKEPEEALPMVDRLDRNPTTVTNRDRMFSTRKPSYVSKLRV